jgi:LPPG:FO 2-phospho-L-lactate transferase
MVDGATLSEITAEITAALGLACRLLPVTDDSLRTMVTLATGEEIDFQTYFVARHHADDVSSIRFEGWPDATAGPGVIEAIDDAEVVVIAPSNPVVSIGPLLAVGGVETAILEARDRVVAVSPIVAGAALKGPADRLLEQLGHEASVVGVARLYAPLCAALVIDEADRDLAGAVEAEGVRCVVTDTIMRTPEISAALARTVLAAVVEQ